MVISVAKKKLQCISYEGGNPSDAISPCYADTSFPDLLGRPSLHYVDQASAMQTVPTRYAVNERPTWPIKAQLLLNLGFHV